MTIAQSAIRQEVGAMLTLGGGDPPMLTGTPTGTYSTTGFAASALGTYATTYFKDWHGRFYAGTHKDTEFTVTAFTTTTGEFVFTPAVVANVDATDLFELWRDFAPATINLNIKSVIRAVENEVLSDKVDESLVVNDLLTDGLFESWATASSLNSWTTGGAGTLAREATIKLEGSYSAHMTNTVSNAYTLSQSVSNPAKFAGRTASLYARINTLTASRVRIRLTDGVTTWNSDYHDGTGWREDEGEPWLKIDGITLGASPTEITASVRIETGTAIDAYIDKMWLIVGDSIYEYTMPSGFYALESVWEEGSVVGRFDRLIDARHWRILGASTKKLWFDSAKVTLTSGRKLRLMGQSSATTLTLDADTTSISPAYLENQLAADLFGKLSKEARDVAGYQMGLKQAIANGERARLFVPTRGVVV